VYQINLDLGWNLVTLPYINNSYTADDLANDIGADCTHVSKWDNALQKFVVHRKGSAENNFEIKPGIGYHVYVTGSCAFNITGTRVKTVSINLDTGWNSIGWTNDTSTTASGLASKIENCTAVAYWNSTLGRFITYFAGSGISDFKIEKGMACLVYVMSASVWKNG